MYGAIIGDLAGSLYEYLEFVDSLNKDINLERRLSIFDNDDLVHIDPFYSDDTILTIAILDSVLNNISYDINLKKYCRNYLDYRPDVDKYFKTAFSPNFIKWSKGETEGISSGNGSLMRISSIPYLFNDEEKIIEEAYKATTPSHNSKESLLSVKVLCLIIHYLKNNSNKNKVIEEVASSYGYNYNQSITYLQNNNRFTGSSKKSLELALSAVYHTSSFDDAIKVAISFGGDTDTVGAITGSIAEQIYGIENKYIEIIDKKLPPEFVRMLKSGKIH